LEPFKRGERQHPADQAQIDAILAALRMRSVVGGIGLWICHSAQDSFLVLTPQMLAAPPTQTNQAARSFAQGRIKLRADCASDSTSVKQSRFPRGWNEERVSRVLADYESQTEDEAVAEDETGVESTETVMNVPHDLVPRVRELIAKRQN